MQQRKQRERILCYLRFLLFNPLTNLDGFAAKNKFTKVVLLMRQPPISWPLGGKILDVNWLYTI